MALEGFMLKNYKVDSETEAAEVVTVEVSVVDEEVVGVHQGAVVELHEVERVERKEVQKRLSYDCFELSYV